MRTRSTRNHRIWLETLENRLLLSASDLDTTFGGTGLVTNSLGSGASAVVVQPNSKVIVAGTASGNPLTGFGIIRYNTDGTFDTSFNGKGTVTTNFKNSSSLYGLALVAGSGDEKVVAVGKTVIGVDKRTGQYNWGWALARYNANGTLDTTFGDLAGGGKSRTGMTTIDNATTGDDWATAAVVQPDGKIIVVGPGGGASEQVFEIIRVNTNGTLDTSFNGTGKAVVRFPSGSQITGGEPMGVALDSQGRILVTGLPDEPYPPGAMVLVRLNADGSLDSSFNGDGIAIQPPPAGNDFWFGTSVGIQSSGQIVVAGQLEPTGGPYETFLARINADGSLDNDPNTGFGPSHTGYDIDTRMMVDIWAGIHGRMCVQGDDKVVVTGATNGVSGFTELRVTAAGLPDTTFGTNGLATQLQGQSATADAIAMAPDGKIAVVGSYNSQFSTIRLMGGSSSPMTATPEWATATQPDAITILGDWDHALALLVGSASPRKRGAGSTVLALCDPPNDTNGP
jgi:uncharacterized delta-60 repeat protein